MDAQAVLADPHEAVSQAGLRYVSDEASGYRRRRRGKGFAYYTEGGEHVRDEKLLERAAKLVIPPNWRDVWLCKSPNGHLQATGYDERGRKQYLYHEKWREVRDQAKFEAMIPFGEALPSLRKQVAQDLARSGLPKVKLVAALISLLEATLIRVGNREYARENEHYGLTTLRKKHVDVSGAWLEFSFVGKSGKAHQVSLEDRKLAKVVKACYEIPGYELFQYLDEGEKRVIDSSDINDYLREATGEAFTAKDFRTWAGTVLTAEVLCGEDCPELAKERKKRLSSVIKDVAARLGNTPAVCRSSYVHPTILADFKAGDFSPRYSELAARLEPNVPERLSLGEAAVLAYLKARQA